MQVLSYSILFDVFVLHSVCCLRSDVYSLCAPAIAADILGLQWYKTGSRSPTMHLSRLYLVLMNGKGTRPVTSLLLDRRYKKIKPSGVLVLWYDKHSIRYIPRYAAGWSASLLSRTTLILLRSVNPTQFDSATSFSWTAVTWMLAFCRLSLTWKLIIRWPCLATNLDKIHWISHLTRMNANETALSNLMPNNAFEPVSKCIGTEFFSASSACEQDANASSNRLTRGITSAERTEPITCLDL